MNIIGWEKHWDKFKEKDKNIKPKFGMIISEVPQYIKDQNELNSGALVVQVIRGRAAYYADVKPNDILTSVDGEQVLTMTHGLSLMASVTKGRSVLSVLRGHKQKNIVVKL
jgi:S1-C subfamily serine protease